MSKKMPEHIKSNFIYRKTWNDIYKRSKNATFPCLGDVGTGKSYSALRMASDLDSSFADHVEERVCFSTLDFLKLLKEKKLSRGTASILDEIAGSEYGADSRSFMSKENQTMSFVSTIFRKLGTINFYCLPFYSQLDKRLRMIGISGVVIFKRVEDGKAIADFRWGSPNALTDKILLPRPRLTLANNKRVVIFSIAVPSPSKDVIRKYEKLKSRFIQESVERWYNDLADMEKNTIAGASKSAAGKLREWHELILKDPSQYKEGKRFSAPMIQLASGLSAQNCYALARILNAKGGK